MGYPVPVQAAPLHIPEVMRRVRHTRLAHLTLDSLIRGGFEYPRQVACPADPLQRRVWQNPVPAHEPYQLMRVPAHSMTVSSKTNSVLLVSEIPHPKPLPRKEGGAFRIRFSPPLFTGGRG